MGSLNGVFIILSSWYLIFYTSPVYAVPTATRNDGHNLFFVFTIVTATGWVVVGSLKSVFSAFGYTYTPVITYGMHFVQFKGSVRSVV